ncbi:MAG: adenine phosphoribosyltransferase, partial [Planctomycetota bacterium]
MTLSDHIRDVPDFPKPGILFKDISPLLANCDALTEAVRVMAEPYKVDPPSAVLAVEARGFLFAVPMAM